VAVDHPDGDGLTSRAGIGPGHQGGSRAERLIRRTLGPPAGLEPEPGCAVETVGGATEVLRDLDPNWIGVCLDACHSAVQFESPTDALAQLSAAGVPIVKMQASAALRVEPGRIEELQDFVEPRFLHQTRTLEDAAVLGVDDLDQALDGGLPRDDEWRVHFHVPVHLDQGRTTQPQLREKRKRE